MQTLSSRRFLPVALTAAALLTFAAAGRADTTYHVSLNTSSLTTLASPPGPFSLDFQLIDGGDPSNNTATISNFNFGTGGSAPTDDLGASSNGTASGGLASGTISLADDALTNELYEAFTPGSSLTFDVTLTTNPEPSATSNPDAFTFSLLDGGLTAIPTLDPTMADTLVAVDIADTPIVSTFATDPSRALSDGTATPAIEAPTAVAAAVPEASSFASLGLLLVGLGAFAVRCTRRTA